MTVSTLRPNSTVASGSGVTGAANAHTALNDNSDASYVTAGLLLPVEVGLQDLTLPSDARIKLVAFRTRLSAPSGIATINASVLPFMGNTGALTVSWATPQTVTFVTATTNVSTGSPITKADVDAGTAAIGLTGSNPVRAFEFYVDVTLVAKPTLTVGPTGAVNNTNQPAVVWTPPDAPALYSARTVR